MKRSDYDNVFKEVFMLDSVNTDMTMEDVEEWDSVGHMMLITALEDGFDIMLDADDIVALNSYEKGIEILEKYGIELED